jgi:hypothetical protein
MKRFPSSHGARVSFDPLRSATPTPAARPVRRSGPIPRGAPIPRDEEGTVPPPKAAKAESEKPRSPSFVEIDVVEANLHEDPRYDGDDER